MTTQSKTSLIEYIKTAFESKIDIITVANNELTIAIAVENLHATLQQLRDDEHTQFNQLIDLCGVDYLHYGLADWETQTASETGFSRGVDKHAEVIAKHHGKRFAVVYHLLSTTLNHRIRVKVFVDDQEPLPSVHDIWQVANWFEREAYDLFGLLFVGHPDLRRILTDYGFIGFPFRKDFPLIGHVEMRYDADLQKVVYEPVSIESRTLVPKVIREDNRYLDLSRGKHDA
jgi:NADH-quinone oxidoreductase subunit C